MEYLKKKLSAKTEKKDVRINVKSKVKKKEGKGARWGRKKTQRIKINEGREKDKEYLY